MKIIDNFIEKSNGSFDTEQLTRMLLKSIDSLCKKSVTAYIFLPFHSLQEWICAGLIDPALADCETASVVDELSCLAEHFSGFPSEIYKYTDLPSLEEVYGGKLPLFAKGQEVAIYAAEDSCETLAVGIFMSPKGVKEKDLQYLSQLMEIYAGRLSAISRVHNRISKHFVAPWDEGWLEFEEDAEDESDFDI